MTARLSRAWSKLRWSLAQRGPAQTLRFALQRLRGKIEETKPRLHPFDERYGVDTSGLIGGGELRSGHKNDVFNTAYYGMAPSRFSWGMEQWLADESHPRIEAYSFVDLGCGKGRAVMMASQWSFRQAIGVELNAPLSEVAKANATVWQSAGRASCPMQILCKDATEFTFPAGPVLLYLFNPFAAPVVERLIERIESEFSSRPGEMDLIYFNPAHENLFLRRAGFRLLRTGTIPTSEEDMTVDWVASVDDVCSVYRWEGVSCTGS